MNIDFYSQLYKAYNYIMQLSGFNYQIRRFIFSTTKYKNVKSILEVGCGTGITGLSLLRLYPTANLLLTDINQELLYKLRDKTSNKSTVLLGVSDISNPLQVESLNGYPIQIKQEGYDIICAGANIGYSSNPDTTILSLYRALKPGGRIIDLEMRANLCGRIISKLYCYPILSPEQIYSVIGSKGAIITINRVSWRYFPLNLTRIFITIAKPLD